MKVKELLNEEIINDLQRVMADNIKEITFTNEKLTHQDKINVETYNEIYNLLYDLYNKKKVEIEI